MASYQKPVESGRLVIICSDERSVPLVSGRSPTIRLPGGVLDSLCSCSSGATAGVREAILIDRIKLLITAKNPAAIEIVTHSHCAAQAHIGLSDGEVQEYVEAFVKKLREAGVRLPVCVIHDDHCVEGVKRRHRLRFRCDPALAA